MKRSKRKITHSVPMWHHKALCGSGLINSHYLIQGYREHRWSLITCARCLKKRPKKRKAGV